MCKPKKFDSVHRSFLLVRRWGLGSLEPRLSVADFVLQPKLRDKMRNGKPGFKAKVWGQDYNPRGWRLKHLHGKFRSPEVEILLHKVMLGR